MIAIAGEYITGVGKQCNELISIMCLAGRGIMIQC